MTIVPVITPQWLKLIPGMAGVGIGLSPGSMLLPRMASILVIIRHCLKLIPGMEKHVAAAQVEGDDEFVIVSVAKAHTWYTWCRVLGCRWESCCYCAG